MTESSWPAVVPMPTYENVGEASDWLCSAFGFREQHRYLDDEGRVTTAILRVAGGGVVMPGRTSGEYRSPRRHAEECEQVRRWQESPFVVDGILVTVPDVDAHAASARAAGARILTEPEDTPAGRHYRVEDLEGHRWMFSEPVPE